MAYKKTGKVLDTFGLKLDFSFFGMLSTIIFVAIIIPWRIVTTLFKFAINPKWEQIRAIERVAVIPMINIFSGERAATQTLHSLIDRYFEEFERARHSGTAIMIRPIYQGHDDIIDGYRLTKAITALGMAIFYIVFAAFLLDLAGFVLLAIGTVITSVAGMISSVSQAGGNILAAFATSAVLGFFVYAVAYIYLGWMTLVAYHFIAHGVKEVIQISSDELHDFLVDNTDYTMAKLRETNGDDAANLVWGAIKETVILNQADFLQKDYQDVEIIIKKITEK